jgi:hypothetical protein
MDGTSVVPDLVTITVRLIRSFEQRNIRFVVLKDVDLTWTTEQLIEKTFQGSMLQNSHFGRKPFG